MKVKTLQMFLKARERERSTSVYACDALWIISGALGNKLPRYSELIERQTAKVSNKTTEEVVHEIVDVLQKDIERRGKNGKSSI